MDKKTAIDSLAREAHEKGGFTGAWLYAENDRIITKGTLGFRDKDESIPITEDTVFQLASVSKQFTATAVMLLKRNGLLSLDDDINRFFPEIPFKGVTIYHLLTHTCGLPDLYGKDMWIARRSKEENTIPDNDVIIRYLCESGEPALFLPGERSEYSNTGYCLLAEIVEKVSGTAFEDFLKDNIFEPAGMHSTRVLHVRKDGSAPKEYATGFIVDDDRYFIPDTHEGSDWVVWFDGMHGKGNVHSTINDLYKWHIALRDEKILTHEEQKEMATPCRLNNGEIDFNVGLKSRYGFGWFIDDMPDGDTIVSHTGHWAGNETYFERLLNGDRVLIFLSNHLPLDARANRSFWTGMKAIFKDEEPEAVSSIVDITVKDSDESGWESFCGKYDHEEDCLFGVEEVFIKDGELHAVAVDDSIRTSFRLYPAGDNIFIRKSGLEKFEFADGCIIVDGVKNKKL